MAVTLIHNCPHCPTKNAGFTLVGEANIPRSTYGWLAFFRCNTCFGPLAIQLRNETNATMQKLDGELRYIRGITNLEVFPKPAPSCAPSHTPEAVARAFIQAEDAIKMQHWEAAGAMDRRALEISTKEMAPEHAALKLYKRIEKLADSGRLTPSLKEWAHDLRIVGNDALHEIDGLTEDEATQTHELARFVLIYLYTLPAQVEEARKARESGD
jgi:hypothetical protein